MTLLLSATVDGEQHHWLLERSPTSVGRGSTNTIQLLDGTVSKKHAEFTFNGWSWVVRDLGSFVGTRVNGREARGPLMVSAGDRVEVGHVLLHATEADPGDWARFSSDEQVWPQPTSEEASAMWLQRSMLREPPALPGWLCHARIDPGREVGGDFYDLHVRADGALVLLVGDVSGKGMGAASLMSSTLSSARLLYEESRGALQLVKRLNALVHRSGGSKGFVTMFVGWLDPTSGLLRYVNAGNPEPYLIRRGRLRTLEAKGIPTGMLPDFDWKESEVVLEDAETLAVFSDGIPEARYGTQSFGFERLADILREAEAEPDLSTLADRVTSRLDAFIAPERRSDDLTLVLLRRD
jgi:sigma-B regulation protein RsbU (phosphoserine phosphatase)